MDYKLIFFISLTALVNGKGHHKRIIGGIPANENDFPYLVSVQKMVYVYVHICGGALIKENFVLTAAHCITNTSMQVLAGSQRIVDSIDPKSLVIQRYIHPNYSNVNNRTTNDVAVLKLEKNFTLSSSIQLINLPSLNTIASGRAIFSGWGTTNSSVNTFSNSKMFTILDIISLNQCSQALTNSTGSNRTLSDGNICTLSTTSFSCYRDDGGPLAQNSTLIGIAAWQIVPCDAKNAPSVFTNVSGYVTWINQQLLN